MAGGMEPLPFSRMLNTPEITAMAMGLSWASHARVIPVKPTPPVTPVDSVWSIPATCTIPASPQIPPLRNIVRSTTRPTRIPA